MLIKKSLTLLLALSTLGLLSCDKETPVEPTLVDTTPAVNATSENVKQPANSLTPEQLAARRVERQAKREQRLAELSPEELAEKLDREARRAARRDAKQNDSDTPETEVEKQARQAQRRKDKKNERLQQKEWWNKLGNKNTELALSEQQITEFNTKLQELLVTREQIGTQLQPLWQSNQEALASGNIGLISSNLENIERLESQWQAQRRAASMAILESLDNQQLAALSKAGGDIASLNWINVTLDKDLQKPQSNRQQQRANRRQQSSSN